MFSYSIVMFNELCSSEWTLTAQSTGLICCFGNLSRLQHIQLCVCSYVSKIRFLDAIFKNKIISLQQFSFFSGLFFLVLDISTHLLSAMNKAWIFTPNQQSSIEQEFLLHLPVRTFSELLTILACPILTPPPPPTVVLKALFRFFLNYNTLPMKKIETSQSREGMKENRNSQRTWCKKRVSHLRALGKTKKLWWWQRWGN